MSMNNSSPVDSILNHIEYPDSYNDEYDVNSVNKLNKQRFKKINDYNNEIQLRINSRILQSRTRDARYSLKNRRIVNKDWKDFNNNQ
jgi:hypothetical protein